MQNPLHHHLNFNYPFNFGMAAVFDLTANGGEHPLHPSLGGRARALMGRSPSASPNGSPSPAHDGTGQTEAAANHIFFPQSLFGENFGAFYRQGYGIGQGQREEAEEPDPRRSTSAAAAAAAYYQEKMFKKVSEGAKSFTIDSLLGLNSAAARAAFQNGIAETHRQQLGGSGGMNLTMAMEWNRQQYQNNTDKSGLNGTGANTKERFHPYTSNLTNNNNNTSIPYKRKAAGGNGHQTSVTTGATTRDKPQDEVPNLRRAGKAKRVRTIFTPEQLERLEAEFERQQYMVGPERLYLASSLNLTEAQVKVWFQNRRIKWRKQHLELQQQRLAVLRSQQLDLEDEASSEFGSSASSPSTPTVSSMPETTEPEARTGPSFQPKSSTGEDAAARPEMNESINFNNANQHNASPHLKLESARNSNSALDSDYQTR